MAESKYSAESIQVLSGLDPVRTALLCELIQEVHAENGGVIDVLVKKALAEGKTAPKYHALTRPARAEGEARPPRRGAGAARAAPAQA